MPVFCETNTFDAGFWVAVISGIISFFSLMVALNVSIREKNHYFETNVESCYGPIAAFIYDSYWIISEEKFQGCGDIKAAETNLVKGIHRLEAFAITNNYKVLKDIVPIKKQGDNGSDTFSFYLLKIEDEYIEFRKTHIRGAVTEDQLKAIIEYNLCFRDMLFLLGKYKFTLKGKLFRWKQNSLIKEVKEIWGRAKECNLK